MFQVVDILPGQTPIILGRRFPVIRLPSQDSQAPSKVFDVPLNLAMKVERNGMLIVKTNNHSTFCSIKYLDIESELCTHILYFKYTMQVKPWNFEQHLQLQAPSFRRSLNWLWNYQDYSSYYFCKMEASKLEFPQRNIFLIFYFVLEMSLIASIVFLLKIFVGKKSKVSFCGTHFISVLTNVIQNVYIKLKEIRLVG